MNKDQVKRHHKNAVVKVHDQDQDQAGELVGSKGQAIKGTPTPGTDKTDKRPGNVKQMDQGAGNPANDATPSP